MTGIPSRTFYHRWLGWHAPAVRRAVIVASIGVLVGVALARFVAWELAAIAGWDAAALTLLAAVWPMILRAGGSHVEQLATVEDESHATVAVLLLAASVASLLGVGFTLGLAGRSSGAARVLLVGAAALTIMVSWIVVNTVYTLRYAHLYFSSANRGISFGAAESARPSYRDFAYVAFTIGMTYQVSDTAIRDPRIRRTVLAHAVLSYVFGVVIIAAAINLVAGLLR